MSRNSQIDTNPIQRIDHGSQQGSFEQRTCPKRSGERGRPRAAGMEAIMRNRLYIVIFLLAGSLSQIGCIVPIYSSSPDVRARQLIYQSETYRHIPDIWDYTWGLDMPDVATP